MPDDTMQSLAVRQSWYAGTNEEWFNNGPFATKEEAIAEMRWQHPDRHFFVGQAGKYTPFTRDYVEEFLELEACDVNDECGPVASDNWPPQLSKEACAEANAKIVAILKELCGDCSVFPILDSERIEGAPNAG